MNKILFIVLIILTFLATLFGFVALSYHHSTLIMRAQLFRERDSFATANARLYATVSGIDLSASTITVVVESRFGTGEPSQSTVIHVSGSTRVVRQRFIVNNGAYVGMTNPEPIPLSAVQNGERVTIVTALQGSAILANVITVGDSL